MHRRQFISNFATAIATTRVVVNSGGPTRAPAKSPLTFVLVHGAWHGGWCYREAPTNFIRMGTRYSLRRLRDWETLSSNGHASPTAEPALLAVQYRWFQFFDVALATISFALDVEWLELAGHVFPLAKSVLRTHGQNLRFAR